ncbi:hypothetical protein [Massilia rhizosphaerae]|uniref:hypothetical protein n=1 Tax=Massilia rhizosphaerae TaxID=2784389 RepID=UPI0018DDB580|nr:hypothetical protein [Massilia rhizosphaerae]
MKRLAAGFSGIVFGLMLSWLCLYVFSRLNWPIPSHVPTNDCSDLEHCPTSLATYVQLSATLFGPALLFGLLNAVGWKRLSLREWAVLSGVAVVSTIAFYLAGYLL